MLSPMLQLYFATRSIVSVVICKLLTMNVYICVNFYTSLLGKIEPPLCVGLFKLDVPVE